MSDHKLNKFRPRPEPSVEAVQFIVSKKPWPEGIVGVVEGKTYIGEDWKPDKFALKQNNGSLPIPIRDGDWLVKTHTSNGYYTVVPDTIFKMRYEPESSEAAEAYNAHHFRSHCYSAPFQVSADEYKHLDAIHKYAKDTSPPHDSSRVPNCPCDSCWDGEMLRG